MGGKGFTEQLLLAEMTTRLLNANGFDAEKSDGMGTTVVRSGARDPGRSTSTGSTPAPRS